MPLTIPANHYELSLTHQQTSTLKLGIVTIGLHHVGADLHDSLQIIADSWAENLMPILTSVWHFQSLTARSALGIVEDLQFDVAGGNANPPLSPQVCYLIRKTTGTAGRKNRGRMFLPGCNESNVDGNGRVASDIQLELNTRLGAWAADATGADAEFVILHNSSSDPTTITSLACQSVVATQRRRLR